MGQMSNNAQVAFDTSAGGNAVNGVTASGMNDVIVLLIAVVAITWFAWVCVGAYKAWADKQLHAYDVMFLFLRGLIVLALIAYLLN